jgi:hypothetical protein
MGEYFRWMCDGADMRYFDLHIEGTLECYRLVTSLGHILEILNTGCLNVEGLSGLNP